jgi:long-chain acyl-CoA synthetase
MIIVGGFNVYPREVEEVLFLHPAIQEVAVVGVRDDNYGESVVACIVRKDASLTEQAIMDYCHEHLAKYKCPTKVVVYDELPKNTTGKVMRRILREQMQV